MPLLPLLFCVGMHPAPMDTAVLDKLVEDLRMHKNIAGISVAIVSADEVLMAKGYGFADRERKVKADVNTLFQVGSCTKVFTATLATMLRNDGKIRFDDPISKHLPETVKAAAPEITLLQLLTHTSGLPANPSNRVDKDGVMQPYSREELYKGLADTKPLFPPGQRWSYSNMGYGVLGHILERATGEKYEALLKSKVLDPLKMTDTSITLDATQEARLAARYWPQDRPQQPRPRWVFGEVSAFGGIASTATDMAKFVQAQLKPDVLGKQLVADMRTPLRFFSGRDMGMGLGWWIRRETEFGDVVEHGGEVDGHGSFMAHSPAHGIGVVVLVNLGGDAADLTGHAVLWEAIRQARDARVPTIQEADRFYAEGEWGNAAWAYAQLLKKTPTQTPWRVRQGVALQRDAKNAEALPVLEAALKESPTDVTALTATARASLALGRTVDALRYLEKAIKAGHDPYLVQDAGWSRPLWGHPKIKALLVRDAKLAGLRQKMDSALAVSDWPAALAAADELGAASRDLVAAAVTKYGILFELKKDYDAAYALARKEIRTSLKDDSGSLNDIAWSIVDPENKPGKLDLDLALQAATRAVQITERKNWALLDTLARVHFLKGDKAKALEIEREAYGAAPDEQTKRSLEPFLKEYGG